MAPALATYDRMTAGALIWYLQTVPGGYGFTNRVPAVFLYWTPRRVAIEVLVKDGSKKRICVARDNIMAREAGESIEWTR